MSKDKLCDTAKLPGGRCRFALSPCSTSRIIICRRKNVSRHRTPRGARRRRVRCDAAEQGDRFRILAVVNDLSREPGAGGRWRRARAEILLSGQNWENLQLTAKLTRPARHPGRPCRRDLGRRVDYSGRATGSTTAPSSSSPFSSRPLGPLRYTFSGAATAFRSAAEVGHDLARRRQHLRVRRTDQRNDVRDGHRPLDRDQRAGRGRDELADLPERSGARPAGHHHRLR